MFRCQLENKLVVYDKNLVFLWRIAGYDVVFCWIELHKKSLLAVRASYYNFYCYFYSYCHCLQLIKRGERVG